MKTLNLGFLASGQGSNMQSIIDACQRGHLNARPVVVISNNAASGAMERARIAKLPTYYLSKNTHSDPDELDRAILDALQKHNVDLIILAGYMKKIGQNILNAFKNRIINIHPSLLPRFGGKGMYGIKVHKAVLDAGESETGVTIHLVNDEYDGGLILAQHIVPVHPGDTAKLLAERVLEVEHVLYVETLQKIIDEKIKLPEI